MIYSLAKTIAKSQIAAYGGEGGEGIELGITCPPDRVPQTPAGGLRPPALPAQQSGNFI